MSPYPEGFLEWSPDGAQIVLSLLGEGRIGNDVVAIVSAATGDLRVVPGAEGGRLPTWSRSGSSLYFFRERDLGRPHLMLMEVELRDGEPRPIAEVPGSGLVSPSPDGASIYVAGPSGVQAVQVGDGSSEQILPPRSVWPFSAARTPGGIVFLGPSQGGQATLYRLPFGSKTPIALGILKGGNALD